MKRTDELTAITNKIITDMATEYDLTIDESKTVASEVLNYIEGKTKETPLSCIFTSTSSITK